VTIQLLQKIRSLWGITLAPPRLHKVGWHLGNTVPISSRSWDIMRRVPPVAVAFVTGEKIQSDDLKRILEINSGCHFFYRPYFAPSSEAAAYQGYIDAVASMIGDDNRSYWEFVPESQRHLQMWNEPNMPRHSQWEGFGSQTDDMIRFNDWFCKAYRQLKEANPTFKIGFTPLTPGNRDAYFRTDPEGVPYYMHGPEAAKEDPAMEEIAAAIRSGPCLEALNLADEYLAHIYVVNDAENQIYRWCYGLRFLQYARFFPKPMDIWITENGIGYPSSNWRLWYELLQSYPQVKGTSIWMLEHEAPTEETLRVLRAFIEVLEEEPPLPIEAIRNAAWNAAEIAYNPDAAFFTYAQDNNLGRPVTNEVDEESGSVVYRLQGFDDGIVFAKVGDWGNVQHVDWL
jgi:hypothetical protein